MLSGWFLPLVQTAIPNLALPLLLTLTQVLAQALTQALTQAPWVSYKKLAPGGYPHNPRFPANAFGFYKLLTLTLILILFIPNPYPRFHRTLK